MAKTWEQKLKRRRYDKQRRLSMPSSVEQLVAKLRAAGYDVPDGYVFRRFYPGHWQRAAGASVKKLLKTKEFHDGPYGEVYGD